MNNSYVYVHYKKGTNVPFYVGKGSSKYRYNSSTSRNRYWHFVVKKHGFDAIKIVDGIDDELAYLSEIELIDKFKKMGFQLTNMTNGGEGHLGLKVRLGDKLSDETKDKLRKANLGKKQSQDVIEKRKKTLKEIGFKPTTKHFLGEKNTNYKGQYVTPNGMFNSLSECAKGNNCTEKKVRINLYGNNCKVNGKIYQYPAKEGWSIILKD